MVMRTIEIKEISYESKEEKHAEIIKEIRKFYPNLNISQKGRKITVGGDLHNWKKRNNIIYILSEGKHGKNIQDS